MIPARCLSAGLRHRRRFFLPDLAQDSQRTAFQRQGQGRRDRAANDSQRSDQTIDARATFRGQQAPDMGLAFPKTLRKNLLSAAPISLRPVYKRGPVSRHMIEAHRSFAGAAGGRRRNFLFSPQPLPHRDINRVSRVFNRIFLGGAVRGDLGKVTARCKKPSVPVFFETDRIGKNHKISHGTGLLKIVFGDIQIAQHFRQKTFADLAAFDRRRSPIEPDKLMSALPSFWRNFKRQISVTRITAQLTDELFSIHSGNLMQDSANLDNTQYCAHKFVNNYAVRTPL